MQPLRRVAPGPSAPVSPASTRHHRRTSTLQTIYDFLRPSTAASARSTFDALEMPLLRPPSPPTPWRSRSSAPSTPGTQPPAHIEMSLVSEAQSAVRAQRAMRLLCDAFVLQLQRRRYIEYSLLNETLVPSPEPTRFYDSYGQHLVSPMPLPQAMHEFLIAAREHIASLEANGSRAELCVSVGHVLHAFTQYYEFIWRLLRSNNGWVARLVVQWRQEVSLCLFDNPRVGPRKCEMSLQPFAALLMLLQGSPLGSEPLHRMLLAHWEGFVAGINAAAQAMHLCNNRAVSPEGSLPALNYAALHYAGVTEKLRAALRGECAASLYSDSSSE